MLPIPNTIHDVSRIARLETKQYCITKLYVVLFKFNITMNCTYMNLLNYKIE